jgi:16S rRNA (guanine527-N7)-methyltransferase
VDGAAALGLQLTSEQQAAFARYAALLRQGKRTLSLTALVDPVDVAVKHFLDSLSVCPLLPGGAGSPGGAVHLIDVGTGAGFPGLPIKLARPDVQVTLLEATAKKAQWVEQVIADLGLQGASVLAARAEDVAHGRQHRARYDVATARAVAPLAVLCELCLPFLRPGGLFVAQKSAAGAAVEVPQAANALSRLGGRLRDVQTVALPALPNRVLVVVEQTTLSPAAYPRRAGMPAKRPLT